VTKDDCFQLGKITKTHGVQGELVFFLDVDVPDAYEELDSVLIDVKGELVPYFVESISVNRNRAIVALEEVNTIEEAQKLINCDLYLPLDNLEELGGESFYFHEIVGFRVRDEALGELGTVTTVYSMSTQDLIAMQYRGQEILIPSHSEIVKTVDRTNRILNVNLPEGLVDVYLDDTPGKSDQRNGDEAEPEEDASDEDEIRFPDED